jgi:hypothetical protein
MNQPMNESASPEHPEAPGRGRPIGGLVVDPEGRIFLADRRGEVGRKSCPVVIVDEVLGLIEQEIAAHPPGRGGVLLGLVGLPVITGFVPDPEEAAGVAFCAPPAFGRSAASIANATLELKGTLRSDSGPMSYSFGSDAMAFGDGSRPAACLSRYVDLIVTAHYRRPIRHEVLLPSGVISVYVSELFAGGAVEVRPAQVQVMPIGRDIARLASALGGEASPLGTIDVDGMAYVSAVVRLEGLELTLLFAPTYPVQSPIVLVENCGHGVGTSATRGPLDIAVPDHGIVPVPISWDLTVPEQSRLEYALGVRNGGEGAHRPTQR